jgi:hypothetical protein
MVDVFAELEKDNFCFSEEFRKIKLVETTAYLEYLEWDEIEKNNK